jgi:hypothetical protein
MGIWCHRSASDEGALIGMCGRNEELWLSVAAHWRIAMACTHCKAINTHCL